MQPPKNGDQAFGHRTAMGVLDQCKPPVGGTTDEHANHRMTCTRTPTLQSPEVFKPDF